MFQSPGAILAVFAIIVSATSCGDAVVRESSNQGGSGTNTKLTNEIEPREWQIEATWLCDDIDVTVPQEQPKPTRLHDSLGAAVADRRNTQPGVETTAARPAAGPQLRGLRLGLQVSTLHHTAHGKRISVQLFNTGSDSITLKALESSGDRDSYRRYLTSIIRFQSYPQVIPEALGGSMPSRREQIPELKLAPGAKYEVAWNMRDPRAIGGPGGLRFKRDGTYLVRAQVVLHDSKYTPIKLWSNEQTLTMGPVDIAPPACTATVLESKSADNVLLNVGRNDRVKVGEFFEAGHAKEILWTLKIVQVSDLFSKAIVVEQSGDATNRRWPQAGALVRFAK